MKVTRHSYGYYHVVIAPDAMQKLLHTNNERAFLVSQLQDILSPRFLLNDLPAHWQFASCVDLLAFSITQRAVHLVVFAIDAHLATTLANRLVTQLKRYQSDYRYTQKEIAMRVTARKLAGPHQALARSVEIHALHEDWEYDRYSSIGFYLHDRRGDWMRLWRVAQLYDNDTSHYRELMDQYVYRTTSSATIESLRLLAS